MTAPDEPRGQDANEHDRRPPLHPRHDAPNRAASPSPFERLGRSDAELQRIVDAIRTQAWCLGPDGTVACLNQR